MPDSENGKRTVPAIRWSPTIEMGHLLQALVMLAAIGGWALAGYYTIQGQLSQQATKMELLQQRLTDYERNTTELRDNLKIALTETRQSFSKISDQIADLRTLVAGSSDRAPRR